jgi:hypothetical protein
MSVGMAGQSEVSNQRGWSPEKNSWDKHGGKRMKSLDGVKEETPAVYLFTALRLRPAISG